MPTILFCHQRLDGEGDLFVNNADEVRLLLRRRGNGDLRRIDGVHYYTLRAMVEGSGTDNSSYAIVDVGADGIPVTGCRRAVTQELPMS